MKLTQLAQLLGSTVENLTEDIDITGISTLQDAQPHQVSFITDKKFLSAVPASRAGALIISQALAPIDRPYIPLKDAWAGTLTALKHFYPGFARHTYQGIHPTAVIDPTAALAPDVSIGPNAVIGPDVTIGSGTYIGPGVVIGAQCQIGENCTLYANVVLESHTRLGNGIYIQPGAVLGADGFKYEILNGQWTKIPQVGHVEISDDVEIGANTCIDRASYTVTNIGPNTKLDNLVQIAHNVKIGSNTVIVSQSGIAGSTTVGDYSILAAQAGIADNLKVGSRAVILGQSGVKNDVKDGETWFGSPARPFRHAARIIGVENKLPDLAAEVTRLTKKIDELEQTLQQLIKNNQE